MVNFSSNVSAARASLAALVVLGSSLFAGSAMAQTAHSKTPAAPKPKISAKQAEATAVKKIGGKALSAKYEFEEGHWQYAVIVKNKKGEWYEVAVNSTTGVVLNTEKTSAAEEAKEDAEDKKKAAGGAKEKPEADEKGEKSEAPNRQRVRNKESNHTIFRPGRTFTARSEYGDKKSHRHAMTEPTKPVAGSMPTPPKNLPQRIAAFIAGRLTLPTGASLVAFSFSRAFSPSSANRVKL